MKEPDSKKPKEIKPDVDFTNVSPDDIAKKFLETPPKPKKNKIKKEA